jgi:hypothetical protein
VTEKRENFLLLTLECSRIFLLPDLLEVFFPKVEFAKSLFDETWNESCKTKLQNLPQKVFKQRIPSATHEKLSPFRYWCFKAFFVVAIALA